MYSSTTFREIVGLYERAGQLLAQGELTDDEQIEFANIRATLDQLWTHRRAELVRITSGPPRLVGGGTEADQKRTVVQALLGGA